MFSKDVAIIGTGRVGLPLGLSMCEAGLLTIGIDRDTDLLVKVNTKEMPFDEPGCDELIKKVDFKIVNNITEIVHCSNVIITVGTPLLAHMETDLSQVNSVLASVCRHLQPGHNIILRSTVAPGTTEYVKKYIEKETPFVIGQNIFLSFCPERIAEGKALNEIHSLPQIIGCHDEGSFIRARDIFAHLTGEIFRTDYISAELVKLFNNISRYIHFAVSNQFMIVAEKFNANIHEIIDMANYKYPRGILAKPGFAAGTCLRKDFGMINEHIPYTDLLLSAWKINEFLPKFLVETISQRINLFQKHIAILGYTFKMDADDSRDSLIPKLIRYIEREVPASISIHDPLMPELIEGIFQNHDLKHVLMNADVVFIGANHSVFKDNFQQIHNYAKSGAFFVDIWNVGQTSQTIFQK